jgi:hypothetical protein
LCIPQALDLDYLLSLVNTTPGTLQVRWLTYREDGFVEALALALVFGVGPQEQVVATGDAEGARGESRDIALQVHQHDPVDEEPEPIGSGFRAHLKGERDVPSLNKLGPGTKSGQQMRRAKANEGDVTLRLASRAECRE